MRIGSGAASRIDKIQLADALSGRYQDRTFEGLGRFVDLAECLQCKAKVVVDVDILGRILACLFLRFGKKLQGLVEKIASPRIVWTDSERLLIACDRLLGAAEFHQ